MAIPFFLKKALKWVSGNRERLGLLVGVILVGILCFEAGMLRGALREIEPLVISIPVWQETPVLDKEGADLAPTVATQVRPAVQSDTQACLFVGSRHSDKYHLPTCAVAKRIKLENRVCFASKEDAERKGYVAGCLK